MFYLSKYIVGTGLITNNNKYFGTNVFKFGYLFSQITACGDFLIKMLSRNTS